MSDVINNPQTSTELDTYRRKLLKATALVAPISILPLLQACSTSPSGPSMGRVVVIGGGFGGATAAKYLRLWSEGRIEVTLVEREAHFISCPMSNLVLSGIKSLEDISVSYRGLKKIGVDVLQAEVSQIDQMKKLVKLASGRDLPYDKLVVSPGIDFMYDGIAGLDSKARETILHAWKAGEQTVELRKQLEAMPNGGVYVLSIPKAPYRCPPAPYERACQIALYFKRFKPKSKVLILDANEDIQSKKGLFTKAWKDLYAGIIEYQNTTQIVAVDAAKQTVSLELGDVIKADVINVIPPQRAAGIAASAGLVNVNNHWCDVHWLTMESKVHANIHVLGDAVFPAPAMPKSGHMANQHGKVAAAAIVAALSGRISPQSVTMANICYSFIDDKQAIHVGSVHRWDAEKKTLNPVAGSGGLSAVASVQEGQNAESWAKSIWADTLA